MAISAAAASAQMGATSDARLYLLLDALDVRRNCWVTAARRPSQPNGPIEYPRQRRWLSPGVWHFFRELKGLGMSESRLYLNVSDADLFEHLADYALLRRRCKLMVAVDGKAGVHRTVHRWLTLIRLGELVLRIRNDPALDKLRIDNAGDSRALFKRCPIDYGRGQKGFLHQVVDER